MAITGGCLCGAVRYEIEDPMSFMGNCHCSMCRRWSGAAYSTWGILGEAAFRWSAGEDLVQAYASSPGRERCFCSKCGSPLVSKHAGVIGEVVAGSLDGDPGLRPREHIFVGSKAPWHEICDDLPRHDGWPPGMES